MSGSALMMQCCCSREFEVCYCQEIAPDTMTITMFTGRSLGRFDTESPFCGWNSPASKEDTEVISASLQASIPVVCTAGTEYKYQAGDPLTVAGTFNRSEVIVNDDGGHLPCCSPPYSCETVNTTETNVFTDTASGGGTYPGVGDYGDVRINRVNATTKVRRGSIATIPVEVREYYGGEGFELNPEHYYRTTSASVSLEVRGTSVDQIETVYPCNPEQGGTTTTTTEPMFNVSFGQTVVLHSDLGPSCDVRDPGIAMSPATSSISPLYGGFTPITVSTYEEGPSSICGGGTYCSCQSNSEGLVPPGYTQDRASYFYWGVSL